MSETYEMEAHCQNCGRSWLIEIPKKTAVIVYEKRLLCPDCELGDVRISRKLSFR